jgi:hypothetical protein
MSIRLLTTLAGGAATSFCCFFLNGVFFFLGLIFLGLFFFFPVLFYVASFFCALDGPASSTAPFVLFLYMHFSLINDKYSKIHITINNSK